MELQRFQLEALFPRSRCAVDSGNRPFQPCFDRTVEEHGQIGAHTAGCQLVELVYYRKVEPPAIPLIGYGGVGEPVTKNDPACFEGGSDHLAHMLGARRRVKEQFGERRDGMIFRIQENIADLIGNGATSRLPGDRNRMAGSFQPPGQKPELGGFAAPLDSLECDETGHA